MQGEKRNSGPESNYPEYAEGKTLVLRDTRKNHRLRRVKA